jgi:hypothetical protein
MLVVVPLLGGCLHSCPSPVRLVIAAGAGFAFFAGVVRMGRDPLFGFIADCIGEAVGDLVAWHMVSYALRGAF